MILTIIAPIAVAIVFIAITSLIAEPARRNFMAIMIAGAGAAYLSGGGLGPWEFVFCSVLTWCAYQGLGSYRFIGIGWLLHTGWDVMHHLYGNPIIPFSATSSLGCAICDPVIAAWCFAGAPSLYERFSLTRPKASRIPFNSASGRGGHPGIYTSTGTTLSTPPRDA
jgi:hypothetical protein